MSIELSGLNCFSGISEAVIIERSLRVSLDRSVRLFDLVTFTWENILSSLPLEAGRENSSSTNGSFRTKSTQLMDDHLRIWTKFYTYIVYGKLLLHT